MSQGRGSAVAAMMVVFVVVMVIHSEVTEAATYTVGASGWRFNTESWPQGKRFVAGDILVFNYNPKFHNVVAVNKGGYDSCSTPRGARTYTSGRDQIKLVKGWNFFICNFPGHCQSAMKIAVNAA